jgi:hypothetical protein
MAILACDSGEQTSHSWSADTTWAALDSTGSSGAWLSGTGTEQHEVWLVGGQPGDGSAQCWSAGEWFDKTPSGSGLLWWIHDIPGSGVVVVGEAGQAWLYQQGEWSQLRIGTNAETLYGVWGSSSDSIWVVGSKMTEAGTVGLFEHWDGSAWLPVSVAQEGGEESLPALYKVWGTDDEPLVVVGASGLALHHREGQWQIEETAATGSILFTVTGRSADDIYAIGSIPIPVLIHWDGDSWTSLELPDTVPAILQGVWTTEGAPLYISGLGGFVASLNEGKWQLADTGTALALHAIFAVTDLGLFAVGGDIESRKAHYMGTAVTTAQKMSQLGVE